MMHEIVYWIVLFIIANVLMQYLSGRGNALDNAWDGVFILIANLFLLAIVGLRLLVALVIYTITHW